MSYYHSGSIFSFQSKKIEIKLNDKLDKKNSYTTICHELAHLFLGHLGISDIKDIVNDKKITIPIRKNLSLSQKEIEAETTSYLVCSKINLYAKSAEYLSIYIKNPNDLKYISYDTIIKAAKQILELPKKLKKTNLEKGKRKK